MSGSSIFTDCLYSESRSSWTLYMPVWWKIPSNSQPSFIITVPKVLPSCLWFKDFSTFSSINNYILIILTDCPVDAGHWKSNHGRDERIKKRIIRVKYSFRSSTSILSIIWEEREPLVMLQSVEYKSFVASAFCWFICWWWNQLKILHNNLS